MCNFSDALHYLYSFISYERETDWHYSDKTLNLDRFRELLRMLDHPQDQLKTIHIAGSDGKGSVCVMIASVLQELGYRVGLYLSPHLHNIRERISINGQWISEADFTHWIFLLKRKMETLPPLPGGYATFFELLTAMAFLHFRKESVDYTVIETGLGGRLDATNVMNPLLTAITHISLEHTDKLGNTLEEIADEKLGITRPQVPVVIGHQDQHLLPHFRRRLHSHSSSVIFTDTRYRLLSQKRGRQFRTLEIQGGMDSENRRIVHIPLFGHYQFQNTLTAVAALDVLKKTKGIRPFTEAELDRGLRSLQWAGRFEIIPAQGKAVTVLDVAHTVKGAVSLRLSLDEVFPQRKRIFVMGFLKGKNVREMIQALIRPQDRVYFTVAPSPRGQSIPDILREIAGIFDIQQEVHTLDHPLQAYRQAQTTASAKDVIVVCGSLYLVGEIRQGILQV